MAGFQRHFLAAKLLCIANNLSYGQYVSVKRQREINKKEKIMFFYREKKEAKYLQE